MERQNIPLRQGDYLQAGINQQNPNFNYFPTYLPSNNVQTYNTAKAEVQRWANWVKFMSIFLIAKGFLTLISLVMFPSLKASSDAIKYELGMILYFMAIGIVGLRAGISKTTSATKSYIVMLIGHVILEGVLMYYYTPVFINNFCDEMESELNTNNQNTEQFACDESFKNSVYAIVAIIYLVGFALICTPICWCPCKLHKNAKIVEQGCNQNFQMAPAQSFQYAPVIGSAI